MRFRGLVSVSDWLVPPRVVRYDYDARGSATTLTYDAVGNLVKVDQLDGTSTRYTYDERDSVSEMASSSGRDIHNTYDERGHVESVETVEPSTKTHTMTTHAVDSEGRLRRVTTYPTWPVKVNATVVEFGYDANGQQTEYLVSPYLEPRESAPTCILNINPV